MTRQRLIARALALLCFCLTGRALAVDDFRLAVTNSPNPGVVSNTMVYTVSITNISGISLTNIVATNGLSALVLYQGGTVLSPATGVVTNTANAIIAQINFLTNGGVAQYQFNVSPTALGSLTNGIGVNASNRTNIVTTNFVTQIVFGTADLAVGLTNLAAGLLVNDPTVFGLSVTNLGTNTVSGVVVSNIFPPSFKVLSVSPTNASVTTNAGLLRWNVGTLTGGARSQLSVSVQPTNSGTFSIAATVAGNVTDTNTANNSVTNTMDVGGFLPSDLTVTVLSQQVNHQTGLLEMLVSLANNAETNVPAARVAISNLVSGSYLYNAVGTNSGSPFVRYDSTLAGGTSVNLTLEFYVLVRAPITNQPFAFAVPAISLTAPTNSATAVTNYALGSGGFLIEFPAVIGKTYKIIYSADMTFSNALAAQPDIVAPATRVQWIDNGPPKTVSHPTNTPSRFYRVIQVQ